MQYTICPNVVENAITKGKNNATSVLHYFLSICDDKICIDSEWKILDEYRKALDKNDMDITVAKLFVANLITFLENNDWDKLSIIKNVATTYSNFQDLVIDIANKSVWKNVLTYDLQDYSWYGCEALQMKDVTEFIGSIRAANQTTNIQANIINWLQTQTSDSVLNN